MQIPLHESTPALAGQSLRVLIWDRDLVDMWSLDELGARQPYRGQGSRWHYHPELELTAITRGAGLLYVGDHIGRFAAPDCLLLGRNVPHVWKSQGDTAGVSLQFRLDAGASPTALPEFAALARLWARARHGLRWQGATADDLRRQLLGMEAQPALQRLARFIAIVDTMRAAGPSAALPLSREALFHDEADQRDAAMNHVLEHIMERSRDEIRLPEVVRLSGMSQATFCRRFARATGKTFSAYLNAIRLQEVRRALLDSQRSVTEIALGAGFTSLTNFYALFRRSVGCTPRAFRQSFGQA